MTPERFKHIRTRAGYTQKKLGIYLCITDRAVRRYEAGDRAVSGPASNLMEILLYHVDRRTRRPQAFLSRP